MGVATVAALSLAAAVPAAADQGRYGHNDGGGFRNVLPPGSDGVDTAADFGRFVADGALPRHWADQQPLYEGLLYASPGLTDPQIPDYFKDATFGVKRSQRASTVRPRAGVTIIRDKEWGVPRVYGKTRNDTMFGAGYAGASDRLFLMDVLRHTGRADLSSFLGGSNLASDEEQWRFAPYTDKDLRRQLSLAKQLGPLGRRSVTDLVAYVAGINAYIAEARQDADLMPVEYGLIGKELEDWKKTDVVATASLIGGIFGKGGGGSVNAAQILRALEKRFGMQQGRRIWTGFRAKNDPEAPTTVTQRFPYLTGNSFAKRGLALPQGKVTPAPFVSGSGISAASADDPAHDGTGLFDAAWPADRRQPHASNWELVSAKHSRNGRPLAVMGPQVGYYLPQILVEQELHGPGIDARGVAFAGVNLYVQMGHGRDYAWSATSAGSDNVDTFAEVLCGNSRTHYRYKGTCRPMEKLTRSNSWTPNVIDPTPAGSATLTAYRTVHGIVQSYGKVNGKRVAFAVARTTYMHETESAIGFSQLNDPGVVTSPRTFQKAAMGINFTFNWAYTDAKQTAYFLSGDYPRRAPGTSPDFPILGTGKYDWQGFDPKTWTADVIGFDEHPQAVDPAVLVSWNNKPAPGWGAADDQWGYGPIYRSQMIEQRIRADIADGRKMRMSDLVQAMEEPATQDIRGVKLLPTLFTAIGSPSDPQLKSALNELRSWRAAGSHRRDLDRDGAYEHTDAIEIMDAWWPLLVEAQFRPTLGRKAYEAVQSIIGIGAVPGGSPRAPGFADGWWGYVDKDLRTLFAASTPKGSLASPGGLGRVFCGDGDRRDCRSDLRRALRAALDVTPEQMYAFGACTDEPTPACWDRNRPRVTAAINKPGAFPFQNRPTFQQVVSVKRNLRR